MLTENNLTLGGHDRYLPKEVVLGYVGLILFKSLITIHQISLIQFKLLLAASSAINISK